MQLAPRKKILKFLKNRKQKNKTFRLQQFVICRF